MCCIITQKQKLTTFEWLIVCERFFVKTHMMRCFNIDIPRVVFSSFAIKATTYILLFFITMFDYLLLLKLTFLAIFILQSFIKCLSFLQYKHFNFFYQRIGIMLLFHFLVETFVGVLCIFLP